MVQLKTFPSNILPHLLCRTAYCCSFVGLLVVVNKQVAYSIDLSHAFIFASGALLTVSLLHLVPEATEVRRRFLLRMCIKTAA